MNKNHTNYVYMSLYSPPAEDLSKNLNWSISDVDSKHSSQSEEPCEFLAINSNSLL